MNKGIFFMGVLGFLAGAVVAGGFTYGVMNSEALEAEAHAHAAEDRAGACEAKFQKSTVIYDTTPPPSTVGVNLLGGLVRLSPGATLTNGTIAVPMPRYVIPAEVRPQSMDGGGFYSWVDPKTHVVEGPWKIQ